MSGSQTKKTGSAQAARTRRAASGGDRRIANPRRSSNGLREDVLRVLGVMKVATADQIQRAAAPHLTYRHTAKPTAARRKEARTAAHRGALADLRSSGHVLFGGHTRDAQGLRLLTPLGLDSARSELGRPKEEMGGTARGAGRSGASHAMAVNETILALLRPKPDLSLLAGEPPEALAAAQAAVDAPPGLGTLGSYFTEVQLPVTGTWATPGRGSVQADIVVTASGSGVPLLFVEVDNCFEDAAVLVEKVDRYARFFARTSKTGNKELAMWRQRWTGLRDGYLERVHPPVLLVFNPVGPRNSDATTRQVAQRTVQHWAGVEREDHSTYDGCIPIVGTTLDLLREHGPAGPAFWRFGRAKGLQCLVDAIGNPRKDASEARARAESARRAAEYRAEQERAREARRPRCTACGEKFTDQRWEEVNKGGWDDVDSHRTLCAGCKQQAIQVEQARKAAKKEAARLRREAEAAAEAEAARKANRFLGRFRP